MILLIKNNGSILEPSVGNGSFWNILNYEKKTGIEIDENICPNDAINCDFFIYPDTTFDTIIGNPPYVAYKDILSLTKQNLKKYFNNKFDERTNLYMFFIAKCLKHLKNNGELIFITPRGFIKSTSCINLNKELYKQGTITHFYEQGDLKIFKDVSPNCVIWRFEKGKFSRKTITNVGIRNFWEYEGQLFFTKEKYTKNFSDLFYVKVGAVSGLDKIFADESGNMDFVYSKTRTTGETRKMIYNVKDNPKILMNKGVLIKRKIKKFDETNWWKWGRRFHKTDKKRIYVNCKTRTKNPFFLHECKNYDGAVLAIFPKNDNIDIVNACNMLNKVDWKDLGFVCDDRFIFSQKALQNTFLPDWFEL